MIEISKITNVSAEAGNGTFGISIGIHLDNGQIIFLSLESKSSDPAYIELYRDRRLLKPKTNGDSIYWQDGPRLTFEEIMEILEG